MGKSASPRPFPARFERLGPARTHGGVSFVMPRKEASCLLKGGGGASTPQNCLPVPLLLGRFQQRLLLTFWVGVLVSAFGAIRETRVSLKPHWVHREAYWRRGRRGYAHMVFRCLIYMLGSALGRRASSNCFFFCFPFLFHLSHSLLRDYSHVNQRTRRDARFWTMPSKTWL